MSEQDQNPIAPSSKQSHHVTLSTTNIAAWIIIIAIFVTAIVVYTHHTSVETLPEDNYTVVIYEAGDNEIRLPLDKNTTCTLTSPLGSNTITIKQMTVTMTATDCDDNVCMEAETISVPGEQLICEPHDLMVEIVLEKSNEMVSN